MPPYSFPLLIASDHAGLNLKNELKKSRTDLDWQDLGCFSLERTDYPDWAKQLCQSLQDNMFGVLICGTGQGMCIQANRYLTVRAALCWDEELARLARSHNKANVLCLPGRFLTPSQALKILNVFLTTKFDDQEAYKRRVKKLSSKV